MYYYFLIFYCICIFTGIILLINKSKHLISVQFIFLIWKIFEIYEKFELNQQNLVYFGISNLPKNIPNKWQFSNSFFSIIIILIGWIFNLGIINSLNFLQIWEALFSFNYDKYYLIKKKRFIK